MAISVLFTSGRAEKLAIWDGLHLPLGMSCFLLHYFFFKRVYVFARIFNDFNAFDDISPGFLNFFFTVKQFKNVSVIHWSICSLLLHNYKMERKTLIFVFKMQGWVFQQSERENYCNNLFNFCFKWKIIVLCRCIKFSFMIIICINYQ